jgi:hypothetical protein
MFVLRVQGVERLGLQLGTVWRSTLQVQLSCCTPALASLIAPQTPSLEPKAIEYEDADAPGKVVQLNMSEQEFREFVGILAGIDEDDDAKGKDKKKKK